MKRYFVNPTYLGAVTVWAETSDFLSDSFVENLRGIGYVECGWLRYQWYKWWKAR